MTARTTIGKPPQLPDGSVIPLSPAVRAGDYVYSSGQVPMTKERTLAGPDVASQTRQVLENLKAVLAEAGCDLSDVVKTQVWLVNREDFAAFNAVYAEFFRENPPARSTVQSGLMGDILVEIEAVAYKPQDG